ncbi:flavodoxin family protein [Echinicola rosea]|uniref:Flavodoxin n=1 Tax=Echinicola rosea TaxID=1807691 RepID=A0ABQ1V924_9BACT|nr:flavodoxin [Echinicola rosea]GGF43211.1 flavodoxin [Echinicola rosea]
MRFFLLFIFLFGSLSCTSQTQTEIDANAVETTPDKILIVYLTRTKNTKAVAKMIEAKVGGTLVSLELETPYPEDYEAIVAQVTVENETGTLPPLKTKVDLSRYETIFVGFPTWGMQLPPPMKTFLNENDLSGKTVIPFNTNAGYGIGSSFETVAELCSESTILEGYSTRGGIERNGVLFVMEGEKEVEVKKEVHDWLTNLGF